MTRCSSLLLCAVVLLGCDASPATIAPVVEGELTAERYDNAMLGWSMPLPRGWSVLSRAEVAAQSGNGRKLMEEALGERIETKQVDLLHLRSSKNSMFTSSREYYDESAGPYAQVAESLFQVVRKSYATADIPIRVERGRETIDGVTFELMRITMLARDDHSREVMQQYMYDALIGNQSFTVSVVAVTAVDDEELEAGLRAWRASTFAKRR